ncbi:hypothetical protein [Pseudomonas sp. SCB32]|uniref:hypothetical protein n=1 Tax=Pseudomonas sp. SCB32 TaxID=2653853 RepID=UPI001264B9EE|nr:hypothetical protein [Pseudomonas sp. SCB32]
MTWAPVTMRWPEQSTQWLNSLDAAKDLATAEQGSTGTRLEALKDLATTSPGPVGAAAGPAVAAGRAALNNSLGEAPACLVVTPFQSGIGSGTGQQRYLSAPNLVQRLADKLRDNTDAGLPQGEQFALVLLFLGTRYDQFAATLGNFNALLPLSDLQRAERRAQQLAELESEKWELPAAGSVLRWAPLPLERCTITKASKQALSSQLAALESYADTSPLADLAALAQRKQSLAQQREQKLTDLRALLAGGTEDITMRARLLGPGDAGELRRQLLQIPAPGHEWALSAGVMLVGSLNGLSFVRELVGL